MNLLKHLFSLVLCLSISHMALAQGETCNAAEEIVAPGTFTVDSIATGNGAAFTGALNAAWYTYTPPATGALTVSSCGGTTDTRLVIITGDCTDLTIYTFSIDDCAAGASIVTTLVTGGVTYYVYWDDAQSTDGFDFELGFEASTAAGPGEDCDNATAIMPGTHTIDSLMGFGAAFAGAVSAEWYTFTPTTDGVLGVNSCGGGAVDTRVFVFDGVCGALVNLSSNDDACEGAAGDGGLASSVENVILEADSTYFIYWDDRHTASGFNFEVTYGPVPMYDVTFRVDMKNETVDATGVFIAGDVINNWDPTATPMVNTSGTIWEYTMNILSGTEVAYKFVNGATWEDNILAICGVDDGTGTGNINRLHVVGFENELTAPYCFNACDVCPPDACANGELICDNFDSYDTLLTTGQQAAFWSVWSLDPDDFGTAVDGIVTNEQAASAPYSMLIAEGSVQDVLLLLGNLETGRYELSWNMYIPTGGNGYYNFQGDQTDPGATFTLQMAFGTDADGNPGVFGIATCFDNNTEFPYDDDTWFNMKHIVDLDNDLLIIYQNDSLITTIDYVSNLGAVDFFSINEINRYYIDDVILNALEPAPANDICTGAVDITSLLNQGVMSNTVSTIFDNTNASPILNPADGWECYGEPDGAGAAPELNNTLYFTFVGDGANYTFSTVECGSTNYITDGDTQMSLYSGPCESLAMLDCNEDGPGATAGNYYSELTFDTEDGQEYIIMIDGFNFQGSLSTGEFCLNVLQNTVAIPTRQVTFRVNMSGYDVPAEGVHIAGDSINNWDPAATACNFLGGGVWSHTMDLAEGTTVKYKFINGNAWGLDETTITADCGIDNGQGSFDRILEVNVGGNITTPVYCFNTCSDSELGECPVATNDLDFDNAIEIFPNPASDFTTISYDFNESTDLNIRVTNNIGQTLVEKMVDSANSGNTRISTKDFATGVYIIQITNGNKYLTEKLIIE